MKNAFYGKTGSRKGLGETLTTLSVNKIIIYQFSMFKSLDSIASVVGIFMYLTISTFKQVLRSRKGLDYNTEFLPLTFVVIMFLNQLLSYSLNCNFFVDNSVV